MTHPDWTTTDHGRSTRQDFIGQGEPTVPEKCKSGEEQTLEAAPKVTEAPKVAAPQEAEPVAWTAAAREMLVAWDSFLGEARSAHRAAAHRLLLAASFGAQAFEDAARAPLTNDAAHGQMLRAFLIALVDPASTELDHLRAVNRAAPAPAVPVEGLRDALIRCREIAMQSEAAPLSMCEIIKRVDLALGDETPLPEWIRAKPAPQDAGQLRAENERLREALKKKTSGNERFVHSKVGHCLAESSWHVHLAGFRSREEASEALDALQLKAGG